MQTMEKSGLSELLNITNSFNNRPTDSINATQQLLYASGDGLTVGNASNTFKVIMAEETKIDEFKLTGTEKDPLFPPGGGKDDSVVNVDRIFPPGGADAENLKEMIGLHNL